MNFIPTHDPQWQPHDAAKGPRPSTLLPLEQWLALRHQWPADLSAGVLLPNGADVGELLADLPRLALLVLQFPKWTDGRAYSQARLLRGRHGYPGDLRASGEVLVDMLPLLQRTGFSSVQLRADQRIDHARRALRFFDGHYQGDLVEPQPLFNRLAA